jgi:non-lysosomal glucosylceramidase
MSDTLEPTRRRFLKQAAGIIGVAAQTLPLAVAAEASSSLQESSEDDETVKRATTHSSESPLHFSYPRIFSGNQLKMISFPLGGVAAGSLGLGGRGQLRNWEIFNRPNKGFSPPYAFPAIWVQSGDDKPIARVLESRITPPYEGQDGLGSRNSPGLSRLERATFTGQFPLAHIDFEDRKLPVHVELDAFTPFIPHDPDDSGLPVGILRYRVTNPDSREAKVGIVFSIDNPVDNGTTTGKRLNEYQTGDGICGLQMKNPGLPPDDPMNGSFVVAAMPETGIEVTHWRGWPEGAWWNSPLLFWDVFSATGKLGAEPSPYNNVGALCQHATIAPGQSAEFTFLLSWHFPNRTPGWCGWSAPPGKEKTIIGNFYCTRFKDAWQAAQYTAQHLKSLEERTRQFAKAFRESSLPPAIKEAASANLTTLVSTTCFRTADGEFHGFEGSSDALGCCYGNCTHVWNYETSTAFLFPSFALSLRKAALGFSEDDDGAIRARQVLPDGITRDDIAATDGHMGQIMHAYLDWRLSGDQVWLKTMWPRIKKAIAFSWDAGGWDAAKSGVLDGVQNNTYDVAFYGPNPLCGIYYLGALRAGEEMAIAVGAEAEAKEYRSLFEKGSAWIDTHLFNGEFYTQEIKGYKQDQINPLLLKGAGGRDTEEPQYQVGKGCLIDQLVGQYLAHVMDLGPLVSEKNINTTLQSIFKYNYKRSMDDHDNVERTFALNDEKAMVICDYGKAVRPHIPFPYFAEVMTGFEYSTAALMIYCGMVDQGIECIYNIRSRYDGEKRNPWDEAECGHHYARAMAAWSGVIAVSGFSYDGARRAVMAVPRAPHRDFTCFWSTGTGWGTFAYKPTATAHSTFELRVLEGKLPCRSFEISGVGSRSTTVINGSKRPSTVEQRSGHSVHRLNDDSVLTKGDEIRIEVHA